MSRCPTRLNSSGVTGAGYRPGLECSSVKRDDPPGVFRNDDLEPAGSGDGVEVKPDWKDFFALVIAAYQILLLPLLLIVGALVLIVVLLNLLAR